MAPPLPRAPSSCVAAPPLPLSRATPATIPAPARAGPRPRRSSPRPVCVRGGRPVISGPLGAARPPPPGGRDAETGGYDGVEGSQNNKKRPHLADLNGPKKKTKVEEKCEFCSSRFGSKKLLLSHQKFQHFVYKCPLCEDTVRGIINGQTHLRNVHKKSAPESRLRFHFVFLLKFTKCYSKILPSNFPKFCLQIFQYFWSLPYFPSLFLPQLQQTLSKDVRLFYSKKV